MRQEDLNPPAHIKQHVDRAALSILASKQASTVRLTGRQNLIAAWELGRTLAQLRKLYSAGEWSPFLATLKISAYRAQTYIRISVFSDNDISEMDSITQALEMLQPETDQTSPVHEAPRVPDQLTPYYEEDESEVIGPNEDPPEEPQKPKPDMQIRCDRCIRLHVAEPCSECLRLRVEAAAAAKFTSPPKPPPRNTGPKNGQEAWEFKRYDKAIGELVRTTDEMLKMAGLMTSPVEEAFRRLYNEALKLAKETWKKAQNQTNTERGT